MKEIKINRNLIVMVDDEDYEFLNQWKWSAHKGASTFYAVRTEYDRGKRKKIRMHRILLYTPDNLQVDHIDHNGLNNQKSNIRNCTKRDNNSNRKPKGKSKYLGVCFDGKYIKAGIGYNYKRIHIGNFKTEIEAAKAYDSKAKELFGIFANLNFK